MAIQSSSADAAAALVRRMIFAGELRPGDRVPQDDIAARLGVSRIPVREALIALEREGWVSIEIHRGAWINALDEVSVRDHYALYALIYGWATSQALARDGHDLAHSLREIERALLATDDPGEVGRLAVAFNAAVVEASGSSRAKLVLRSMTGLLAHDFFRLVPDAIEAVRDGCHQVAEAVDAGDESAARTAYGAMMHGMGQAVVVQFRARGLLDGARPGAASGRSR